MLFLGKVTVLFSSEALLLLILEGQPHRWRGERLEQVWQRGRERGVQELEWHIFAICFAVVVSGRVAEGSGDDDDVMSRAALVDGVGRKGKGR